MFFGVKTNSGNKSDLTMWVGISTGKNKNYGKAGEKKYIANYLKNYVEREGVMINLRYAGSGRLVIKEVESDVKCLTNG